MSAEVGVLAGVEYAQAFCLCHGMLGCGSTRGKGRGLESKARRWYRGARRLQESRRLQCVRRLGIHESGAFGAYRGETFQAPINVLDALQASPEIKAALQRSNPLRTGAANTAARRHRFTET